MSEKLFEEYTLSDFERLVEEKDVLAEGFAQASQMLLSIQMEDSNWLPLNGVEESVGFTLQNIKDIAEKAELQTTGNPLLTQGLRLRTNNVFSKGMHFEGSVAARVQSIIDKPWNQRVLFSQEAYAKNERAVYVAGNLLVAYRKSTSTFFTIPLKEISSSASNPEIQEDVWYYQRTYSETDLATNKPKNQLTVVWYPVLETSDHGPVKAKIANQKVDKDVVVIDFKANAPIGAVWGVPDCLAALPYAWAHAEYIRDASKLLKALSTIAWKVVAKNKANASTAGGKVSGAKRAGGTATMTEGTDLVAMPRSGQVDMKDGQTIASYVASALGVSLVALLSDPGAASGSYGAAASLDGPSANTARARQGLWKTFYDRALRAMGASSASTNFPKLTEDPIYRSAQTLAMGFAGGAIHQSEFREAFLELTDVIPKEKGLPEVSPFTTGAQYSLEAQAADEKKAQETADAANVQGVGVSNGIAVSAGNNDLRDMSATPGTGA